MPTIHRLNCKKYATGNVYLQPEIESSECSSSLLGYWHKAIPGVSGDVGRSPAFQFPRQLNTSDGVTRLQSQWCLLSFSREVWCVLSIMPGGGRLGAGRSVPGGDKARKVSARESTSGAVAVVWGMAMHQLAVHSRPLRQSTYAKPLAGIVRPRLKGVTGCSEAGKMRNALYANRPRKNILHQRFILRAYCAIL